MNREQMLHWLEETIRSGEPLRDAHINSKEFDEYCRSNKCRTQRNNLRLMGCPPQLGVQVIRDDSVSDGVIATMPDNEVGV